MNIKEKIINSSDNLERFTFLETCITGIIVHLVFLVNNFINEDNLLLLFDTGVYNVMYGRWAIPFFSIFLRGNYISQYINGLISIVAMSFFSILLIKIFDIKSKSSIFAVSLVIVSFPTVSYLFSYAYIIDAYFIGMTLALFSVYITIQYKYGFLFGSIILTLSIACYQSNISIAILCILLYIIKLAIQGRDVKNILFHVLKFFLMGVIGAILYLITVKLSVVITGIQLTDYKGISGMGNIDLLCMKETIRLIYIKFINFFVSDVFFRTTPLLKISYISLFALTVFLLVWIIKTNNIYKSFVLIAIIIISLIFLPIGVFIIEIITPTTQSNALNIYSISLLLILPIYLVELLEINSMKVINSIKIIIIVFAIFIGYNYFIIDNVYYLKMNVYYERTYALYNRVLSRIEENVGLNNRKIALLGNITNKNYYGNSIQFDDVIKNDVGLWGEFIGLNSTSSSENTRKFAKITSGLMGVDFLPVDDKELEEIKNSKEFFEMGIWPEKNSINIINDIIVVNFDYPVNIVSEYKKGELKFEISNPYVLPEGCTFAWYLSNDNEYIEQNWYQSEHIYTYSMPLKEGNYYTICFIKNKDGEIIQKVESDKINIKNSN